MGFLSKITKPFKKIVKGIKKIGSKIVKGVKSAVKGIGKALGKLGPLASIALMAIPGFQPLAAGLWGSLGIPAGILQNMATGALTGFVTSGGDMKAALMGGVAAGVGTAIGGAVKGYQTGGFEGISKGITDSFTAPIAPGVTDLKSGWTQAKADWGNFTDSVGDFFKGVGNGNETNGAATYTKASIDSPATGDVLAKTDVVTVDPAVPVESEMYKAGTDVRITPAETTPIDTDWSGGIDSYSLEGGTSRFDTLGGSLKEYETFKYADLSQEAYKRGLTPAEVASATEKATTLADKNAIIEKMVGDVYDEPYTYSPSNYQEMLANRQASYSASLPQAPTTTTTTSKSATEMAKKALSSLLGGKEEGGLSFTLPEYDTSAGDLAEVSLSSAGGTAGGLGSTQTQEQYVPYLLAPTKQLQQYYAQRAKAGWRMA